MRWLFVPIILLGLCLTSNSHAVSSNDMKLSEMIRAPNLTQFKLKLGEIRQLESLQAECEIQLKFEMLPGSCFEVIKIEKNRHLLSNEAFYKARLWLTENCMDRASRLVDSSKTKIKVSSLPSGCREIALQKLRDQHYREITMNPVGLFIRRL